MLIRRGSVGSTRSALRTTGSRRDVSSCVVSPSGPGSRRCHTRPLRSTDRGRGRGPRGGTPRRLGRNRSHPWRPLHRHRGGLGGAARWIRGHGRSRGRRRVFRPPILGGIGDRHGARPGGGRVHAAGDICSPRWLAIPDSRSRSRCSIVAVVRSWCPIPATYLPGVTETAAEQQESQGISWTRWPPFHTRERPPPSAPRRRCYHPLKGEESD